MHCMIVLTAVRASMPYAVGITAGLGALGNLASFLTFRQQRRCQRLQVNDRTPVTCLMFLATMDLLFCVSVLPTVLLPRRYNYSLALYYRLYGFALVNMFLTGSIMATVLAATERLIVVARPLKAFVFLSARNMNVCIIGVCVFSFCVNAPILFRYEPSQVIVNNSVPQNLTLNISRDIDHYTFEGDGPISYVVRTRTDYRSFRYTYRLLRAVLCNMLPQLILFISTVFIVIERRNARSHHLKVDQPPVNTNCTRPDMEDNCCEHDNLEQQDTQVDLKNLRLQRQRTPPRRHLQNQAQQSLASLILVAICVQFLVLMSPVEIVKQTLLALRYQPSSCVYILVKQVLNYNQLLCSSTNFLLYVWLNKKFRHFLFTPGLWRRRDACIVLPRTNATQTSLISPTERAAFRRRSTIRLVDSPTELILMRYTTPQ